MSWLSRVPSRVAQVPVPAEVLWACRRIMEETNTAAAEYGLPVWDVQISESTEPGSELVTLSASMPVIRGLVLAGVHTRGNGLHALAGSDLAQMPSLPKDSVVCSQCGTRRAKKHYVFADPETGALAGTVAPRCVDAWLDGRPFSEGAQRFPDWTLVDPVAPIEELSVRAARKRVIPVVAALATAMYVTDMEGFVSRARAARDGRWSTAERVQDIVARASAETGDLSRLPTEIQDLLLAAAVLRTSVLDELPADSDYHRQILNVLSGEHVSDYAFGLIASIPVVYRRFIREQQQTLLLDQDSDGGVFTSNEHVGSLGQRIRLEGVLIVEARSLDTGSTLVVMRDPRGRRLTWFASRSGAVPPEGSHVTLTATVRHHREFKGCADTTVNRCVFR